MRHRTRLFAVTLTCAVALVGCGSQPSVRAESAGTGIPDDFPLSSGMGGPEDTIPTSRTGNGLRDLAVCGTAPLRGVGTRDRMVADNSGGEAAHTRELVLLGSPEEADALARSFADLATGCDVPEKDGFLTSTEVRESPYGPRPAVTLLQTYTLDGETAPGTTVVQVVPAGAALLVTSIYGEWSAADLEGGIAQTVDRARETVSALSLFEPTESAPPQAAAEIPDGFPLLAGWPADSTAEAGDGYGRQGPSRDADSFEFRACDERWAEPAYVDRLRSDWVNAEDYRSRQLTTYEDAATATAVVEDLIAQQRACPTDPVGEDGLGTTREVRPVALGDEAWAILERDTFDGSPSIFGGSALVVRVGRAVLAVSHGGHAGYPSGDGQLQTDAMGSQASEAIAKMCVFTRTGC
jgi:hypothetical protein